MNKKTVLYPWSDEPNNNGMTIAELARAFQVSEEEIHQAVKGSTVAINEKEEEIIYWIDIPGLRDYFINKKDSRLWD